MKNKNQVIAFEFEGLFMVKLDPNRHEAGWIYPPYDFWIGFGQLNFYQKFRNIFGGEN